MSKSIAAILSCVLLLWGGQAALADQVTLKLGDSGLEITGALLSYDGEFYHLETEAGPLTVDGNTASCIGASCPDTESFVTVIRLSGAPTIGRELIPALLESFAMRRGLLLTKRDEDEDRLEFEIRKRTGENTLARIQVTLSSTRQGFLDQATHNTDIVMANREATLGEITRSKSAGLGDLTTPSRSRIIALDALVPLVSLRNPAQSLTMAQLRAAFAGEIENWQALQDDATASDAPIALHIPALGSGLNDFFSAKVLNGAKLSDNVYLHEDISALSADVARDRLALGVGRFSAMNRAVQLALTDPCGTIHEATEVTIKSEDYPLVVPLFLVLPQQPLPRLGREFIRYATSPAAQNVIRRVGFIDQFPEAIPIASQGNRLSYAISQAGSEVQLRDLQRMVRQLQGRERLSVTFRFRDGSSVLDAQSRSNINLLATALERGLFDGRTLTFVGFSDGVGPAAGNLRLSRARAKAVHDAVQSATHTPSAPRYRLETRAFGEALPMACDSTDWGRQINRRVEAWLQ